MILSDFTKDSASGDEFAALLNESNLSPTENGDVAIDLAGRGFAVFPIRDWGDGDGWKPIVDFPSRASSDPEQIAAWWRRWPEARLGLLADARNGVTVLDLDVKNGKDGVASLAALGFSDLAALSPVRVRTPSGGWHLYFKHEPRLQNSTSTIGDGIDIKTYHAVAYAPGSVKDGRRYEPIGAALGSVELPPFPESLIPPAKPEREPVDIVANATDEQRDWAAERLAALCDELASTPEGSRETTFNAAVLWAGGAAAHGFLTREQVEPALRDAALRCGLTDREIRAKFKPRGAWEDGRANPITDFPPAITADDFDDLPRDDTTESRSDFDDAPTSLRFYTPAECAAAPSRGYVVKGLLAPGDVACVYGAPGAGKSLIAPHIGYAVAQGRPAFGMRTRPGSVLYVAPEDPQGMRGRVSALLRRHGDAPEFSVVEGVSDLLANGSRDLKALRRAIDDHRPALVFLDTLAMAFPGLEENSAEAMGRVVKVARALARHGAAVVLIHHDTKAQSPTPRGHSIFNGALDMAMQLFPRDEFGVVRGKLTKNRNGPGDRVLAFRIETETLCIDQDGDPVTAALVAELDSSASPRRQKLSPSEAAALSLLRKLQDPRALSLSEDAWRMACIEARSVSAADKEESRRKAAQRAFQGLVRKGVVSIREGVARVVPTGEAEDNGELIPFG